MDEGRSISLSGSSVNLSVSFRDMIDLDPLNEEDAAQLHDLITKHHAYTNSTVAKFILKDWENQLRHFVKVFPKEYKAALANAAQKGVKKGVSKR